MRSVLRGGLIGALPGALLLLVPFALHNLGVITADQSQIGFAGVPLLFLGVVVGTLLGASQTEHRAKVMLGVSGGFVVGVGGSLLVDAVLRGMGVTMAGTWLFVASGAMIAGGMVGAAWGEHRQLSRQSASRR